MVLHDLQERLDEVDGHRKDVFCTGLSGPVRFEPGNNCVTAYRSTSACCSGIVEFKGKRLISRLSM
jgi:hypothetical protein